MYSMVIALDEPKDLRFGALSAAPTFSRIVSRIVGIPHRPQPGIQRKSTQKKRVVFSSLETERVKNDVKNEMLSDQNSIHHIPRVLGLSVREALREMAKREVEVEVVGNGTVLRQEPAPGTRVEPGMVCKLKCQEWGADAE